MELGTIFVKMANFQKLTAQELQFLELTGRDIQKSAVQVGAMYDSWKLNNDVHLKGADIKEAAITNGSIASATITTPGWGDAPLTPYTLQKAGNQNLPSGGASYTYVSYGTTYYGEVQTSRYFQLDPADDTKILLLNSATDMLITGSLDVGASGAGTLKAAWFLSNGRTDELDIMPLLTTGGTTLTFSSIIRTGGATWLKIGAWQDSGSTIAITYSGTYVHMQVS